jgi:molecular chaperone GrpE
MNDDEPPAAEQMQILSERFDLAWRLRELESEHVRELRRILLSFIEVVDSFDRLLAGDQLGEHPDTVRLIARQLEKALANSGVTSRPSLGQEADPARHEIVAAQPASQQADVIIAELERGWEWDGEMLRRAKVIVAAAPADRKRE